MGKSTHRATKNRNEFENSFLKLFLIRNFETKVFGFKLVPNLETNYEIRVW